MPQSEHTGILLVTHGDYGEPMVAAAEAIVGPLEVSVTTVRPGAEAEGIRRSVLERIKGQDCGRGVLVLTDLRGSTPANVCQALACQRRDCEVVTGLNLPMLVKLSTCDRTAGPRQIAEDLLGTSRRSITVGGSGQVNGGLRGD